MENKIKPNMPRHQIEECYEKYGKDMMNYCLYLTGNYQMSEDLVQTAFVKLIDHQSKSNRIDSPKNWLFVTLRNEAFAQLNKAARFSYNLPEAINEDLSVEQKIFIDQILSKLKSDERSLILLREYQRFNIKEIAAMHETTEEATRVRLFRIRKKMQALAKE